LVNKYSQEELKKIAKELVTEILKFKNYGRVRETYIDGRSKYYTDLRPYHRIGMFLEHQNNPFSWNEDDDYCERAYDAFGVIDDCPKFEEWENFAKELVKRKEKELSVRVEMSLKGLKYNLTLDVTVYPYPAYPVN
jgi:hypothetical protein